MTINALIGSIELGMIYAVLALGVFLSFRTLNTPDLTVDGSIVTGAAASAMLCTLDVHPVIGLIAAFAGGACAGAVTALLNTKLKIQPLLAGILVMLGIYSINLRIMGNKANLPLTRSDTIYSKAAELFPQDSAKLIIGGLMLILSIALFFFFLKTRLGFALRATGDNEEMVRAAGISSDNMKLLGLAVSNGFVGLAGGLLAQYQGYADIGMGVGMVVIGLASVIIGEVIFGTSCLLRRLIAVCLGAIVYRLVLAIALNFGMQATDMKLVSAVIVVIALSLGVLGESFSIRKKKRGAGNA
ncbi:MAG: ABC transporter permease [Firmicutes bacterium]|nr:ABC transporter permease [Bacillota bacterium]NBI64192.1 ABC transporter permease [Clostridiales bacterium]